jgi:hypothetical protein
MILFILIKRKTEGKTERKAEKKQRESRMKKSGTTIYDLPYDIHLNITNHLSIQDAKNFACFIQNEKNVKNHLLSREYMRSFLKHNPIIKSLHYLIVRSAVYYVRDVIKYYSQSQYRPVRLNTMLGTLYTQHPEMVNNCFFLSDIKVPELPNRTFSVSFQSFSRSIMEIYYGGLDVHVVIFDDEMTKTRTIFTRLPYDCEEYVFGFTASLVRLLSSIIGTNPKFLNWKVKCEYILCNIVPNQPCIRIVSANYNTRSADVFKHMFYEKMLIYTFMDMNIEYVVEQWNVDRSLITKDMALLQYPPHMDYGTETMLQELGFPDNNDVKTNIYVNVEDNSYIEYTLDEQMQGTPEEYADF